MLHRQDFSEQKYKTPFTFEPSIQPFYIQIIYAHRQQRRGNMAANNRTAFDAVIEGKADIKNYSATYSVTLAGRRCMGYRGRKTLY
jgi:hypothetical protein